MDRRASGIAGRYQKVMPITDKNLGKNYLKMGNTLHSTQGSKERERRLKQQAKREAKLQARKERSENEHHT